MMAHDLVIRGGRVVDGTGREAYEADVAVDGGRITEIGRVSDGGSTELDADGHAVTPGFIDGHTHFDAQVMWDPLGTSSCYHGVTSVVMGNCGFTLAPVRPDARELVIRNLERAEDIAPAALDAGIEWSWEHFSEYLDAVERTPKGINFAAQIGHSALRTWAMGERAFEEEASEDDLAAMQVELREAMAAGAVGFTTSQIDQHETSDDRPVASRLASWDEICRLVTIVGDHGAGVFEITPAFSNRGLSPDERRLLMEQLHDLAVVSGVPITFGAGGGNPAVIDLIERTVADGGQMFGQTHSRGIQVVLSFRSRMPFDVLPTWKHVRAADHDDQLRALRDPSVREVLVYEAHSGDYGRAIGAEARAPDWGTMRIYDNPIPPNQTVADAAAEQGVDPVELIIDLALASDLAQLFTQPLSATPDDVLVEALRSPHNVMTFSDSGAHVSQIADSSIQTHLLAYWVRERQAFTFEDAIRMLTSVPAARWGFSGRGVIRGGCVADLNVIDPATVSPELPTVEHDLPGGCKRLVQKSRGIHATIVGGEPVLVDGEPTGRLPGSLLRGQRRP
jgi:N-acyl-D-amino-acid deacylase